MEITQTTVFHRQLDILSPSIIPPITIIGCGAVGSAVGVMLAKLGAMDVTLWDGDTIEPHNVANQMFDRAHAGNNKATALSTNMEYASPTDGTNYRANETHWDNETTTPIMIVAVDSMDTRKAIYETLKTKMGVRFVIDARMGGEMFRIHSGDMRLPEYQTFYEKTLYSDEEAEPLPCTARGIAYNTFAIAGQIGAILKQYLTDEQPPKELIQDLKGKTLFVC